MKYLFASVVLTITLSTFGFGQASSKGSALMARGTGLITGRITSEAKPVEGIRVILFPVSDSAEMPAFTAQGISDSDGLYRLANVPAGNFTLTIEPNVYVLPNETSRPSPKRSVILGEGQTISNVDLNLVRGGMLTGRITDADGEPIIGELVSLQRLDEKGKAHSFPVVNQSPSTDDLGVFRVYGLPAGKYIVSVTRRSRPRLSTNENVNTLYTPRTYYPGVTNESLAAILEVKENSEIRDVDIAISEPIQTHTAFGQVIDSSTGQGAPNIGVSWTMVSPASPSGSSVRPQATTDNEGRFRLENLKSGKYVVSSLAGTSGSYTDGLPFEIIDTDVSGLQLNLVKGASVAGVVEIVGGENNIDLRSRLSQVAILGMQQDRSDSSGATAWARNQLNPDGSFTLNGLKPGTVRLGIYSYELKDLSLLRVEVNGVDQTRGIQIGPQESISGVKLVLVFGKGQIVGQVKSSEGPLPLGSRTSVIAIPLGSSFPKRKFAEVDAEGRFTLIDLPSGEYDIQVTSRLPVRDGRQGQMLTGQKSVSVKSGLAEQITIVVDSVRK